MFSSLARTRVGIEKEKEKTPRTQDSSFLNIRDNAAIQEPFTRISRAIINIHNEMNNRYLRDMFSHLFF